MEFNTFDTNLYTLRGDIIDRISFLDLQIWFIGFITWCTIGAHYCIQCNKVHTNAN